MAVNYEFKILLDETQVSVFEDALEEVAAAVLTVLIETGENAGKWELQAIFEGMPDEDEVCFALKCGADRCGILAPRVDIVAMPDKNWLQESYQSFRPITIGKYFIYGSHIESDEVPNDVIALQIDAATAFGTGEHQTTHGCLQALDELDFVPQSVIDVGCGSGILSMAYAKTYDKPVDCVDIDDESVRVAGLNAKINHLDHLMTVWQSDGYKQVEKTYDLILCNILATPLIDMAPSLAQHLNVGGRAILSGFLYDQEEWVLKAHLDCGLKLVKTYHINGWSTLVVEKNA